MHGSMYFGPGKQASAAPYTDCCCTHDDECVRLLQHVVSAKCVKVLLHSRKMRPSVGETNDGGKKVTTQKETEEKAMGAPSWKEKTE